MSDYNKVREIYRQIRLYDDTFHELIRKIKEIDQAEGRRALYRDIEVSENIIDLYEGYRQFARHNKREITDATESNEPKNSRRTSAGSSDHESSDGEHVIGSSEAFAIGKEIRKCCSAYGIEMRFNLEKVAKYLLKLCSLYTDLVVNEIGSKMDQKLNFIRAAVLINAALIRYGVTGNEKDMYSTTQQLRDFHKKMLMSGVSTHEGDLVQFSKKIKEKLENLRTNEKNNLIKLNKVRQLDQCVTDTKECEEAAISEIRLITTNNTKDYKEIMVEVIKKCLELMNDPPCEFAIVGLGSLARKEITLSSDFEHVIILKNGTPVTEEIREYFRWFTVIFHVIIIGLGETIIPSVNIMGLCDHYSIESENNWFRDEFTPCGLSFDGMMPHACKTPLGRQMPTRNRVDIVELIQTAHKMADYLTKEEQLKNGYMLNDVLSTTCFVYGDEAVYDSFLARCWEIQQPLTAREIFEEKRDMLRKLAEVMTSISMIVSERVDTKKSIYRPITVSLHYLAAISGIRSRSSFDILDELLERKIVNDESYHTLCHALGIALEIRIRSYQSRHRQRNFPGVKDLAKLVGEKYAIDCRTAIMFLLSAVMTLNERRFISHIDCDQIFIPSRESDMWHFSSLYYSLFQDHIDTDFIEGALRSVKKLIVQFNNKEISIGRAYFYMVSRLITLEMGLLKLIQRSTMDTGNRLLIDVAVWTADIFHGFELDEGRLLPSIYMKASLHYMEKKFKEADKCLKMCQAIRGNNKSIVFPDDLINQMTILEVLVKREVLNVADSLDYFVVAIKRKDNTLYGSLAYAIEIGRSLIQMDKSKGYEFLRVILNGLKFRAKSFPPHEFGQLISLLSSTFEDFGHPVDAFNTTLQLATTDNMNVGGDISERYDGRFQANISQHYKYSYGMEINTGKYANFTFNSARYERSVKRNMDGYRQSHAVRVFSSITYGDMISVIMYVMNNSFIPPIPEVIEDYSHTVPVLTALCENLKIGDVAIFEDLLRSTPTKCRKMKLLQPFYYALLKDLSACTDALTPIISTQNDLFNSIYRVPVLLKSHPYTLAASLFTNFSFFESVKIIWKILHGPHGHDSRILEYFLTNILTIMIFRKRKCPLMHLSKCREISLKQTLYYTLQTTGTGILGDHPYLRQSRCYIEDTSRYVLCYNLAVDSLVFDPRSCVILLWKLIHTDKLCDTLNQASISLLMEMIKGIFFTSLNYTLVSRIF